jgi:hypothetical protein
MPDVQTSEQAQNRNQNAVRAVLRNELTWILFILGSAWGIVVGVVLPIQSMQIQLAQVQSQILEIKNTQADIPQIKTDHAVMNTEIDQLNIEVNKLMNQP